MYFHLTKGYLISPTFGRVLELPVLHLQVDELEYQGPRMFQPKGHALPWHGVRVLELTRRTWTAALCGQMMAALGAEVPPIFFAEKR